MADSVGSAWVEVVPDFSDFRKTSNSQMTGILGSAGDTAGAEGSKRFGSSFVGGLGKLALPIAGAFAALGIGRLIGDAISTGIDLAVESIDLASDLNESKNAIKVAYGSAFADVEKLAQGTDVRLGLTEGDFNAIATQFSAFAQTIKSENPAKFIDEISTRGADFASVFNIDVADALALFQSGLAGETEPLRKYGLDLSAAAVNAFAYANGIGVAGTELSETQKQQARYGLLLQQTEKVQGDFKNTSGELANSQRIFQASLDDTKAKFGSALLPALTGFMSVANTQLIPVLSDIAEKVGPLLGTALSEAAPKFGELVTAIAPLIPQLVQAAVELLPPILSFFIAISPLLIDFASNMATAFGSMNAFFGLLAGDVSFEDFIDTVFAGKGSITEFSKSIMSFAIDAGNNLRSFAADVARNIDGAVSFIAGLPGRVMGAVGSFGNLLFSSGKSLIQGFLDGINSMFSRISGTMTGIMDFVAGFFPHSPAEHGPFSGAGWRAVASGGAALAAQFAGGFNSSPMLSPSVSAGLTRFTPDTGASSFAGGGAGVTVHQNITTTEADPRLVGRAIGREFATAIAG